MFTFDIKYCDYRPMIHVLTWPVTLHIPSPKFSLICHLINVGVSPWGKISPCDYSLAVLELAKIFDTYCKTNLSIIDEILPY